MGYICDYCCEQRSMVYCRSDAASLCLSCDRNVHSANALSKRHTRSLLCERCNSQAASVRYVDERISLCQNCDYMNHETSSSSSSSPCHKKQTINCYSGCPSAAELSSIWSFITENPPPNNSSSGCEQELGLMSINEDTVAPSQDAPDQPHPCASSNLNLPKLGCERTRCPGLCDDACMYEAFNIDEVDLTFENYEQLFGVSVNQSEELFQNGGMDSLFGPTDMSFADTNFKDAIQESTAMQPTCSNGASADSMMSTKTEPILCYFSTRQDHAQAQYSTLSFSRHGDTSAGADHQDCGASPMLPMGEPPWCPPCDESPFTPTTRSNAVLRYKEKKKARKFEKSIRYASRKARADVRQRVKGRFIKAGDVYDYDPLSHTRSC